MMQNGLLDEVRKLKRMGYTRNMVSMQGLGYKELLDYLDGDITEEEAIYRIKRDTRHFAKRTADLVPERTGRHLDTEGKFYR